MDIFIAIEASERRHGMISTSIIIWYKKGCGFIRLFVKCWRWSLLFDRLRSWNKYDGNQNMKNRVNCQRMCTRQEILCNLEMLTWLGIECIVGFICKHCICLANSLLTWIVLGGRFSKMPESYSICLYNHWKSIRY